MMISELPLQTTGLHPYEAMQLKMLLRKLKFQIPNLTLSPHRFKYLLLDTTEGIVKDQTLWSDPIKTRRGKSLALLSCPE